MALQFSLMKAGHTKIYIDSGTCTMKLFHTALSTESCPKPFCQNVHIKIETQSVEKDCNDTRNKKGISYYIIICSFLIKFTCIDC